MAFRLIGSIDNQPISVLLEEGCNTVGSEPGVALQLPEATVSRRHAEVVVSGDRVEVRDLESKNGTFVGSRRISARQVHPGMTISFGRVGLTLEEVDAHDLELGMRFVEDPSSAALAATGGSEESTVGLRPVERFVAEFLARLLTEAEAGRGEEALVEIGGHALFSALPALQVRLTARDDPGVVAFSACRESAQATAGAHIEAETGSYRLAVDLPRSEMAEPYQPVLDAVAAIMRLASGRAAEPHPEGSEGASPGPAHPEPRSVVASVQRIYREAVRVAPGDVGVLICGESGTGKEVLASFLHAASGRAEGPFVALNCAALPNDLLEAELFGIERGVATGVDPRPGKFELAHGGTFFLDEIGDMAQSIQGKLLRVLQEAEVFRLGGSRAHAADCRILAATNQDIEVLLEQGAFREDLYYRIATWVVELPALRHRRDDIANLAAHFLREEAGRLGITIRGISTAALDALIAYSWPGNIRELLNEMKRAALFLSDGDALEATRLSPNIVAGRQEAAQGLLEERLARSERLEILRCLQRCNGSPTAAAEELGIGRSTLYRRMKALGIGRQEEP